MSYVEEVEATRALLSFLEQAEKCRSSFERAGMALPEPLRRLSENYVSPDDFLAVDLSVTQKWRPKSFPWRAPKADATTEETK